MAEEPCRVYCIRKRKNRVGFVRVSLYETQRCVYYTVSVKRNPLMDKKKRKYNKYDERVIVTVARYVYVYVLSFFTKDVVSRT